MYNLPVEIIQLILDESEVPPASFDNWSIRAETLLSFCLVNRTWFQIARHELYMYPVIRGRHFRALTAATKAGRWAVTKELRLSDVDVGKREVKDVLGGCRGTLTQLWTADCVRVDLRWIAEAKNLVSLHLYNSSFEAGPALKAYQSSSNLPRTVHTPGELYFPSLQSLSLLGTTHFDETHQRQLMSLSPDNCPQLDAICAPIRPLVADHTVYRRMAFIPRSKADEDQVIITQRVCESFQHQLRALLIDANSLGRAPSTNIVLGPRLQLISLRGATHEVTPIRVGRAFAEFCDSRSYLMSLDPIPPKPGALFPLRPSQLDPGTLYLGKKPFNKGNGRGPLQTSDHILAQKWLELDGKPTFILYRNDLAEITAWDKALNSGFWKVVAELRESSQRNTRIMHKEKKMLDPEGHTRT